MVNKVIMRNLQLINETPQLDLCMQPFYIDEIDSQNEVLFGMRLKEKGIPVYQKDAKIKGLNYENLAITSMD